MWLTSAGPTWSCNEAPFSLLRAFLNITEWSCYILDPQSSHPPSLRTLLPQLTMIWQTTSPRDTFCAATSHSCDMLHLSCGHLLLLGHFIYIWDLPSAPTENLTAWNWSKELFCSTVKRNYRTLWGDPVDEFVELARLTWKQICNANLSLTLRGLFL